MAYISNIVRSEGDPKILRSGSSSLTPADRVVTAIGWFSIGLGLLELIAPHQITRAIGAEGKESLVRTFGVREIGHGMLALSTEKKVGTWSRVAGDGLDLALLLAAMKPENPKRQNAAIALAIVLGVMALDFLAAQAVTTQHRRVDGRRSYRGRSGFPQGVEAAKGAAKDFQAPSDMRAALPFPAETELGKQMAANLPSDVRESRRASA